MLGAPFGKYFLCEKLASGGMAELYLAKLIGPGGFEKQLVIKQISAALSQERQFVELFVTEAKTLVSLSHGNIVPVYELGVVDDTYFIAMEYVDGPTLAELCRAVWAAEQDLAPAMAAYITGELCKGLDYAHRKGAGLIHRDLSPRNVLLSREGEVKLVDFGLAVAADLGQGRGPGPREDSASAPAGAGDGAERGRPAGSFPYMSPEQVRHRSLDARSDLFSAGVLLWEMLTGRALFARDDPDETLAAVLDAPIPPPRELRPDIPIELDRICLKALEREPRARWTSAGQMLAALARYAYSIDPPVTPGALAQLVRQSCPPVPQARVNDGEAGRAGDDEADAPGGDSEAEAPGGDSETERAGDGMDHTRPMEGRPGRRARPGTVRTFAASAQLQDVLAKATPLFPIDALSDPPAAAPAPAPGAATAPAPARGRLAGRLLALGGIALVASAVGLVLSARHAPSRTRRSPPPGPDQTPLTAQRAAGAAVTRDAAPVPTPAPADAAPAPPDAAPAAPHPHTAVATAGPPDAGPRSGGGSGHQHADHARPPARAPGTLQIGANPWADVYVNGAKVGQAPGSWPVAAGPHRVELRYHDARRQFRITINPGATESLGLVNFTTGG